MTTATIRVVTAALVVAGATLMSSLACGGDEPEAKQRAADLETAVAGITTSVIQAEAAVTALTRAFEYPDFHQFKALCAELPPGGYSADDPALLWPRAYREVDEELLRVCADVAFYEMKYGEDTDWAGIATYCRDLLGKALANLPDLSIPQLRRTIDERQ